MDWRESMLSFCGPGILSGISLGDWLHLLRRQQGQIDFSRLPRVASITLQSLKTSVLARVERRKYDPLLKDVIIQPPLFILGHWRNGTTHLHQLIAQDNRFSFPNTYQTAFPRIFLSSEAADSRILSFFMPKHRPMDNVDISLTSPQEDEFALCASCMLSPCMAWVFPRQREEFGRYLTFRNVEWKDALLHFVRKLQSAIEPSIGPQVTSAHRQNPVVAGALSRSEIRAHPSKPFPCLSIYATSAADDVPLARIAAPGFRQC